MSAQDTDQTVVTVPPFEKDVKVQVPPFVKYDIETEVIDVTDDVHLF